MISAPLQLETRLRKPARNFDALFYLNVGVLTLLFGLFGSRFVTFPGVRVVLPQIAKENWTEQAAGRPVLIQRDGQIVFEGGFHSLDSFALQLERLVRERGRVSLIVQADQQVSYQSVFDLSVVALNLGVQVNWAAEKDVAKDTPVLSSPANP